MGSNLKGKDLPAKARNALFKALGRLPVLVLWKWEGNQEELGEDIPKNVVVRPWWPQSDVLGNNSISINNSNSINIINNLSNLFKIKNFHMKHS